MINKYLTSDEVQKLADLQKSLTLTEVNINCIGLYNHGKSSLLNVLIGDFEHQTFKTADVRETTVSKSVQVADIVYTDTPGLNENEDDDRVVMESIFKSDINLFVHTVTAGEFSQAEVDFLHKVKGFWKNPEEFINRTIFVLSRIDKASSEEEVQTVTEKMQQQLKDIFGIELSTFIPVSATRYTKGISENKDTFLNKSNIPQLQKEIQDIVQESKPRIKKTKVERLNRYYDELILKLKSVASRKEKELQKVQKEQKNFENDISQIQQTLSNKYRELESI